jgi:cytochrome c
MTDPAIKPQLRSVILKGYDLFMNTQQLRGKNVFNDMNCRTCHMGEGLRDQHRRSRLQGPARSEEKA